MPELTPERNLVLRHAVLRSALAAGDGGPAVRPRRKAPLGKVPLRLLAVPVAACAVVAGLVVLAPGEAPTGSPGRVEAGRTAPSEAVRLLSHAALAAAAARAEGAARGVRLREEPRRPRGARRGRGPAVLPPAHAREVWLSADGGRPGLLREAGAADTPLGSPGPVYELDRPGAEPRKSTLGAEPPSVTRPTHAYVAALPTDPGVLLRLVREQTRGSGGSGGDADQRAFDAIGTLLAETWAPGGHRRAVPGRGPDPRRDRAVVRDRRGRARGRRRGPYRPRGADAVDLRPYDVGVPRGAHRPRRKHVGRTGGHRPRGVGGAREGAAAAPGEVPEA